MRAKITILALILLAQTLSFADAGPTDDLSWSKDHNEMISTSPLILEDSIVVKTTGGLIAYSHSGEEQWKWNSTQTLLFEISPLYHHELTNLIVTGWTDGQVTAHQPEDGELVWSISTDSPMWGITGRIHESQGTIVIPVETGLLWINPNDGSITREFTFPDNVTGYRHGATSIVTDENVWYLVGDSSNRYESINDNCTIQFFSNSRFNSCSRCATRPLYRCI